MNLVPVPDLLSATQISLETNCHRRWGWRYLEGLREPSDKKLDLGKAVHGMIERFLKHGTPLDLTTREGKIAFAGAHLWPKNATGVEAPSIIELGGHLFQVHLDVAYWEDVVPVVTDHKTTADMGWAKTSKSPPGEKPPKGLPDDIQAVLYAYGAMRLTGREIVKLRWLYYTTATKPKAKAVEAVVSMPDIAPTIERIRASADRAAFARREHRAGRLRVLDLEPNAGFCNSYNRQCPYTELCNLTVEDKWRSFMSQSNAVDQHTQFIKALGANGQPAQPAMQYAQPAPQPQPAPVQYAAAPQQAPAAPMQYAQPAPQPAPAPDLHGPRIAAPPPGVNYPESVPAVPGVPMPEGLRWVFAYTQHGWQWVTERIADQLNPPPPVATLQPQQVAPAPQVAAPQAPMQQMALPQPLPQAAPPQLPAALQGVAVTGVLGGVPIAAQGAPSVPMIGTPPQPVPEPARRGRKKKGETAGTKAAFIDAGQRAVVAFAEWVEDLLAAEGG